VVSLRFETIEETFTPTRPDGTPGSPVTVEIDLAIRGSGWCRTYRGRPGRIADPLDIYSRIADFRGDSTAHGHERWIDTDGMLLRAFNRATACRHRGSVRDSEATRQRVAELARGGRYGRSLEDARVEICSTPECSLTYQLERVALDTVASGGTAETIGMAFGRIRNVLRADGGTVEFVWDDQAGVAVTDAAVASVP